MIFQVLTLLSQGTAESIVMPVIVMQSNLLCKRFDLSSEVVDVYALIDTGATATCISKTLAKKLKLKVIGQSMMNTAGGLKKANRYIIDLKLPNEISFENVRAVEFIGNTNFDILIGMDILMLGDLAITNAEKRTMTSFRVPPAPVHIDFVKR